MKTSTGYMVDRKEHKKLINEHKRIVPELKKAGLKKEAKDQEKDLEELKDKKMKKVEDED